MIYNEISQYHEDVYFDIQTEGIKNLYNDGFKDNYFRNIFYSVLQLYLYLDIDVNMKIVGKFMSLPNVKMKAF